MRLPPKSVLLVATCMAFAPVLAGSVVQAQTVSADDIYNRLAPKTLRGPDAGIRPIAGSQGEAAAALVRQPLVHKVLARPGAVAAGRTEPAAVDAPSVGLTVQFRTGSAELTDAARQQLDQLGLALQRQALATSRFRIEGHTDTVGAPDLNQRLSEQRAGAVVAYLAKTFGIDPRRLEAIGLGESGLAVPTGDQVPEPKNRRVRIVNLGA